MPSDDEFRRVAEDVRALARSLVRDIRGAVERAREQSWNRSQAYGAFSAAGRAGREELRRARAAVRQSADRPRRGHSYGDRHDHGSRPRGPWWLERPSERAGPRSDGWGRRPFSDRAPAAPRRPPAPPLPALRHRHDGSTVLGLVALVFGLAWLAAGTHLIDVSAEGALAVALLVLGGAMVVTARTDWALSRRTWPMMAGAALVLALLVASGSPSGGGFRNLHVGSRTVAPVSWAEVPSQIHGGIGRTVVDLTALTAPPAPGRDLTIDGGVGALVIRLPPALQNVVVDGHIGLGNVVADRVDVVSGFRQSFSWQVGNPASTDPRLALHVNAGVGSVTVTRAVAR